MLDADLATLCAMETRVLVKAVKRNLERFPQDFMFQLGADEMELLRLQSVISNAPGRGGRHYALYTLTEEGVAMLSAMLSAMLNSPRSIVVNIEIIRAFVRLRLLLASNKELARPLDQSETKTDARFRQVFEAIGQLMTPPDPLRRPIGFVTPQQKDDKSKSKAAKAKQ